jgi:poly-gamma-glutamate synthesis protein (capsule biosynthesis protein)
MDWGLAGYEHTKRVLDESHVAHFGAYTTTVDDYFETKIGTTSVVVFGINMITDTWDREKALSVARKMRKEHPGSYVIAYMHWGEEYMHTQNERQRVLAYQLIDGGVDIIIGSHPHVIQGVETYKKGIIFYSLGNFIFDQYFSQETQEGYMLSIDQEDGKIHYKLMPIVSKRSRVEKADLEDTRKILEIISNNSSPSLRHQIKSTGSIVFNIPHRVSN